MVEESQKLDDVRKVAVLVKTYFSEIDPQFPFLMFRIESIKPNTEENTYHAYCSMKASFGSNKRIYYHIKINIDTGKFLSIEKDVKEDES